MKLVMAIVHDDDALSIMDSLNEEGFFVTKLASTGGFLRSGNTTLICGVEDDKTNDVIDIIEKIGRSRKTVTTMNSGSMSMGESYLPLPVEVNIGGATIFVINVDEFKKV